MLKTLKFLKNKFLNIFFGEICINCEKPEKLICDTCLEKIKLEKESKNLNKNKEDILKTIPWIKASLVYKNETVRKSLFLLKYHYNKDISKYLAKITAKDFLIFLKEEINKMNKNNLELKSSSDKNSYKDFFENILILPIPISKKRLIERNYNQSEILIRDILLEIKKENNLDLEKSLITDFLLKTKHTIKFSKTYSHTERENLIKNVFALNSKYDLSLFQNKFIFLIDDITTTGATFYEARNELIKNGFQKEKIFGFTVAH